MKTYEEKQKFADFYLSELCGLTWDDLGDINSLHDCEDTIDIIAACQERLEDAYYPFG